MRSGDNCLTVRELLSEFSASDLLSRFPKYPFEPQGKTHTLDELREELGLPKPTKREETRRHRRAMVEGTRLGRDLIGAMAEYVRFKKSGCNNAVMKYADLGRF